MKPRIFKNGNHWVVAEWKHTFPETGARIYLPLGEGKTPAEAWSAAWPPTLLQRVIALTRKLVHNSAMQQDSTAATMKLAGGSARDSQESAGG